MLLIDWWGVVWEERGGAKLLILLIGERDEVLEGVCASGEGVLARGVLEGVQVRGVLVLKVEGARAEGVSQCEGFFTLEV